MQYPLYLIGRNKNDTTAYLRWLFLEHVTAGNGGAYFDFSGNPGQLLQHIPLDRDTIFFSPMDTDFPLGFNLLHHPKDKRAILEAIINAERSVWPSDIATTRIDLYTKAVILSLFDVPDATLLGLSELFTNEDYRTKVIGHVKDPTLRSFWTRYEKLSDRNKLDFTESTVTRAFTFSIDPIVRNIIGQKRTSFTVKDNSILIATFPQELGTEMGNFLATLLLSALPDEFLVIIDDGHRVGTTAVRQALTRLDLAFSHQYAAQLKDGLRETLIGTASTIAAFATGQTDSKRLSPEFGIVQEQDMLHHMSPGRYRIRGGGQDARHELTLDPVDFPTYDAEKIVKRSRSLYGTPRAEVEAIIARFFDVDKSPACRAKSTKRNW